MVMLVVASKDMYIAANLNSNMKCRLLQVAYKKILSPSCRRSMRI